MKRSAFLAVALTLLGTLLCPAAILQFGSELTPEATGATGTGSVVVTYDDVAQTLLIETSWSGLSGTTTVAHIHCCVATAGTGTVGVAVTPGTLPDFPGGALGVTAGTYVSPVLDLTDAATFTTSFVTNFGGGDLDDARAALIAGMTNRTAYLNIHSTTFPGGEIRGFLAPVPEPSTFVLAGLALAGLAYFRRKRTS